MTRRSRAGGGPESSRPSTAGRVSEPDLEMFHDLHQYVVFRQSLLVREIGPDGYPVPVRGYGDYSDCVKPVAPEDWLAAFTNTIDKVSNFALI